jgi:ABC-type antimicrobial peptide transport system ATPase subunit
LEVQDDDAEAVDYAENYASIVGIPEHPETDEEIKTVEDFQAMLADLSKLHYDRHSRYG